MSEGQAEEEEASEGAASGAGAGSGASASADSGAGADESGPASGGATPPLPHAVSVTTNNPIRVARRTASAHHGPDLHLHLVLALHVEVERDDGARPALEGVGTRVARLGAERVEGEGRQALRHVTPVGQALGRHVELDDDGPLPDPLPRLLREPLPQGF